MNLSEMEEMDQLKVDLTAAQAKIAELMEANNGLAEQVRKLQHDAIDARAGKPKAPAKEAKDQRTPTPQAVEVVEATNCC